MLHICHLLNMDPWANCHHHHNNKEVCQLQSDITLSENIIPTKFEDNFIPDSGLFDKLPDHEEYLAILESKLRKLKSDPDVLHQLAAKREAYMQQLLSEQPECDLVRLALEEPISDSPLLRTILPQKQALSQGEIVELIKYDQLIEDEGEDETVSTPQVTSVQENLENQS